MIKFLHNLALFWVKNAKFFAEFFRENILKIITSDQRHFESIAVRRLHRSRMSNKSDLEYKCTSRRIHTDTGTGLPDGLFSNQKYKFG
jgi:hypothetical protein